MAFNLVRRLEERLEDFFDDRLFLERLDRVDLLEDLDSKEEMDARAVSGGDSCMVKGLGITGGRIGSFCSGNQGNEKSERKLKPYSQRKGS